MNDKRKGGRPRSGSLELRGKTYYARFTVTVDGVSVRKWFDLGTNNKAVARRKRDQRARELAAGGALPSAAEVKAPITCDAFALPWLDARERRGVAAAEYERRYYERVWQPRIGKIAMEDVSVSDVADVLEAAADGEILPTKRKGHTAEPRRYSRQSIQHMRATLVRMFEAARKLEIVAVNRPALAEIPELEEEQKPRAVLTDAEIGQLIACPDVDAEIKVLVLISRTVGGLRSGDLNALDWTAFSPGFETCTIVRRKTRKKKPAPQTLIVPEPVRPFLAAWHARQGEPAKGPVFPVRRGKRAGEVKKRSNMSYADRLRRELLRAGIDRHELHHETPTTRPVDFHSTRRAYGTALARAGVNEQTAMTLGAWSDSKVMARYTQSLIAELPEHAVPYIDPAAAATVTNYEYRPHPVAKLSATGSENSVFSGAGHEARTRDPELGNTTLDHGSSIVSAESVSGPESAPPTKRPRIEGRGQNAWAKLSDRNRAKSRLVTARKSRIVEARYG